MSDVRLLTVKILLFLPEVQIASSIIVAAQGQRTCGSFPAPVVASSAVHQVKALASGGRDQTKCGKRCANSRSAAIPLDSARSRQSRNCSSNWSADRLALEQLQSALSSCRIE